MNDPHFTQSQLRELAEQMRNQRRPKDLSESLRQLGMIGERELLQAKAQERGIGFVDIERIPIDDLPHNLIPTETLKCHQVLPVKKEGNNLWIAMADPADTAGINAVKLHTNCRVIPVQAVPGRIAEALDRWA